MAKNLYTRTLTENLKVENLCNRNVWKDFKFVLQHQRCSAKRHVWFISPQTPEILHVPEYGGLTILQSHPHAAHIGEGFANRRKARSPSSPDLEKQEIKSEFHRRFRLHMTLHHSRMHREVEEMEGRSGTRCLQSKCSLACGAMPTRCPRSEWGSRLYRSDVCIITRSNRGQGRHFYRRLKNKAELWTNKWSVSWSNTY